jgi:hypothetical protein
VPAQVSPFGTLLTHIPVVVLQCFGDVQLASEVQAAWHVPVGAVHTKLVGQDAAAQQTPFWQPPTVEHGVQLPPVQSVALLQVDPWVF